MIELYLKAASEAEMTEALQSALPGIVDRNGRVIRATHDWQIVWGIQVTLQAAVLDDDLNIVTPAVLSTDFHANLICTPEVAEQIPVSIILDPPPSNPQCVWAR